MPRGWACRVAVNAGLWPPRGPHADPRLRADARGGDGGVRQELAAVSVSATISGRGGMLP
jgi:hypothetical protein